MFPTELRFGRSCCHGDAGVGVRGAVTALASAQVASKRALLVSEWIRDRAPMHRSRAADASQSDVD